MSPCPRSAGPSSPATPASSRVGLPAGFGSGFLPGTPGSAVLPAASRPSIEGLSRRSARVYQIDSPHMSVVMIVDAKLDV